MAITRVKSTTVNITDPDKAIDFYTNKLGFELRSDQPFGEGLRWIEVAPPGADTIIILAKGFGMGDGPGGAGAERIGKFTGLVLEAQDMKGTYETLSSKGVKFTETPSMQDYGLIQALFEDQDGNGYVLVGPS
jgi:catechol 2,3-dioxygenase-like lactoylglutathione lyase family enzyme